MDYRLVKQFLNKAVDAFFNFFYKIGDFFVVITELFWAFVDIWYQFFSFFGNLAQYVYYLNLYLIDRISMSNHPIFFWRKSYDSRTNAPKMAYQKGGVTRIPKKYGGGIMNSDASLISRSSSNTTVKISKPQIKPVSSISKPTFSDKKMGSYRPSSEKKNILKTILNGIAEFFIIVKEGVVKFFKKIGSFFSGKLEPVKADNSAGRKSLIDDYMKEYEKKKNR
jgi:hypothetical protein